jgi:hypothetical protein
VISCLFLRHGARSMRQSFEQFLPLAFLAFGRSEGAQGSVVPASTPATGLTSALEVPRVKTGGEDWRAWARSRYDLLLSLIRASGYVADDATAQEIALSLLAQWAHETARGKAEWNNNLGGWRARKRDTYFTARDMMTPNSPLFRWTSYPDLTTAMTDQVMRLVKTFPRGAKLLLAEPKSSRWVEQLGRDGYYGANPAAYARAWATNRAELKGVVQP